MKVRPRFTLTTLFIGSIAVALLLSLSIVTLQNRMLSADNARLRGEVPYFSPAESQALCVRVAGASRHHWAWRCYFPEGSRYVLKLRAADIPHVDDFGKLDGETLVVFSPGEHLVQVSLREDDRGCQLLAQCDDSWTIISLDVALAELTAEKRLPLPDCGRSRSDAFGLLKKFDSHALQDDAYRSGILVWLTSE